MEININQLRPSIAARLAGMLHSQVEEEGPDKVKPKIKKLLEYAINGVGERNATMWYKEGVKLEA